MTSKQKTRILRLLAKLHEDAHACAEEMFKAGVLTGSFEISIRTIMAQFDAIQREEPSP